ncbi:hypothetical protein [Methyloceanibacter caenitepidi]|uniref:Uncharacterized protein n=1 Tax=Methyloceanibacter caenitepidi TaxID=1384459 RepID=A0A0A8K755_9HYPH|nr:hypothetical protein [Methyloceanibacter caenitepidi]BAQ18337.1 hypothetical protein GL4_2904 [Methyloceanibacter caenitepidi]
MTKLRFVVKGETKNGAILTLRRFKSRDEAEDHPVTMKYWKRVWVEEDFTPPAPPPPTDAPLPWRVEAISNKFTYIRDAAGRRVLSLHGVEARRSRIEQVLREAGLVAEAPK